VLWRNNYSQREVRGLIEEREALLERADTNRAGLRVLVQLADLARALPLLTLKQRQALFLMGTVGMSAFDAGNVLGVSKQAAWQRYTHALVRLTEVLNKGGL
jgi:DNA-directed RNA polymerase specialized sigma24 family protein